MDIKTTKELGPGTQIDSILVEVYEVYETKTDKNGQLYKNVSIKDTSGTITYKNRSGHDTTEYAEGTELTEAHKGTSIGIRDCKVNEWPAGSGKKSLQDGTWSIPGQMNNTPASGENTPKGESTPQSGGDKAVTGTSGAPVGRQYTYKDIYQEVLLSLRHDLLPKADCLPNPVIAGNLNATTYTIWAIAKELKCKTIQEVLDKVWPWDRDALTMSNLPARHKQLDQCVRLLDIDDEMLEEFLKANGIESGLLADVPLSAFELIKAKFRARFPQKTELETANAEAKEVAF